MDLLHLSFMKSHCLEFLPVSLVVSHSPFLVCLHLGPLLCLYSVLVYLKKKKKYIYIYIFLAALCLYCYTCRLSLVASRGHSPAAVSPQASHCSGSYCGAQALGTQASVTVLHRLSCSAACGSLPDQELNPCPLTWKADSQQLDHQGRLLHWLSVLYADSSNSRPDVPCIWDSYTQLPTWHLHLGICIDFSDSNEAKFLFFTPQIFSAFSLPHPLSCQGQIKSLKFFSLLSTFPNQLFTKSSWLCCQSIFRIWPFYLLPLLLLVWATTYSVKSDHMPFLCSEPSSGSCLRVKVLPMASSPLWIQLRDLFFHQPQWSPPHTRPEPALGPML